MSGSIDFFNIDGQTDKKIEFEDGYCIDYREDFNASDAETMVINIVFTARKFKIIGIEFDSRWTN